MNGFPSIRNEDTIYFEIGCRKCGLGGKWRIYFDKIKKFLVVCQCGNTVKLDHLVVVNKPDQEKYNMRYFQ